MLDAASTFVDRGFKVKQLKVEGSKLKEEGAEGAPHRVFCRRVRKPLIAKELTEYSFLKSAEEYENAGVNFLLFVEESEGAAIGRAVAAVRVWAEGRSGRGR